MLKYRVETLDGIDAAAQPFYEQTDAGYVLKVEGAAPADELDRWKAKSLKAEQEAIERRKGLKAYEAFGTPDEIAAKLTGKAPEQEALVAQLRKQAEEQVNGWRSRYMQTVQTAATESLRAALARQGATAEGLDLLPLVAAKRMKFDDEGQLSILTPDGVTPMVGKGKNGGATLDDLATELARAYPALVRAEGAAGGGKPPASGGKPGSAVTAQHIANMSPKEKAAFFKANPGVTITE